MSDIEKFISERKTRNPKAWAGFEQKYRKHAIGMLLGMTAVAWIVTFAVYRLGLALGWGTL